MNDPTGKKLSPRRQRTRAARFREIREHAMQLIRSSGVDSLTIQRLADDLDWSPGTLYRYYRSKDALVEDLQTEVVIAIENLIRDQTTQFTTDEERELGLLIVSTLAYADFSVDQPAEFRLLCLSIGDPQPLLSNQELARHTTAALLKPVGDLAELLAAAAAAGALEPGEAMPRALQLWLSVHAMVMTRKLSRLAPEFDPDVMVHNAIGTNLRGFGADPARVHRAFALVSEWRASR